MIIKTQRNYVYAYEVRDGDFMVQTLNAPGPGGGEYYRRLVTEPIERYEAAVDRAVSTADQLVHPIHIVPVDVTDLVTLYGARVERGLAAVMRDCDDHAVRAATYDVLVKLKAVQ